MDSLNTAATGMLAQQTAIDVVANNLANATTTGYKRGRMDGVDLAYQPFQLPTGKTGQLGLGAGPGQLGKEMGQGTFQDTGRELDVAISGDGFIQVTQANGKPAYTRAGNLQVDGNGRMCLSGGQLLQPQVKVPAGATGLTIGPDGEVSATIAGKIQKLGQIDLALFPNPAGLEAVGENLYTDTVNSGKATLAAAGSGGRGLLQQGALEGSNVEVATEMINMIFAQRAFEASGKVVSASDEMLGMANQLRQG